MSTSRTRQGGWVNRKGHPRVCRWCEGAVPAGRFTFCSDACVHAWKLRTDPGYLRAQVFARDKGVCELCGTNTEALRRQKRKLDWEARKRFEKEWGRRRSLWDADHIIPVAEGGGECDLSNMRTLCLKCHRQATAELRARMGRGRAKEPAPDPVFERDRGVCSICGVDTEAVRRERRTLDWAARRAFEKEWGRRHALWEAVGGRTVCVRCVRKGALDGVVHNAGYAGKKSP